MSRRSKKRQPPETPIPPSRVEEAVKEGQISAPAATAGMQVKARRRNWRVAGICALLVILVFIVFGQTVGDGFVNFDDDDYVYQNPMVSRGLSLEGIQWAFTHVHADNWHPLTTMLHMLDCQMYGLWAGGHHLTNVLLHAACAVLLFLLLLEMTGALWRSGFVAAVFAIHPLRVESVAWVSELKDVLSGVFFMLTLWAYTRYARRTESRGRYAMVALWFALGLMSKPMLVTLPFVLLLLDYWPLGRLATWSRLPGLLREKIPLFVLSALSCVATVFAQTEAIQSMPAFPLSERVGNALVAYVVYLEKLIYPSQLAVFYPLLKDGSPAWQVMDACLLLATLTAGAYGLRRKQPFLLVGWLWYLGMLAPVIGVLQVGQQAYADRYTYLPQIGLCLAGTWMAADWAGKRRDRRVMLGSVGLVILCALLLTARRQATYWRDSESLWTHALACTRDSCLAHDNLGCVLFQQGRPEEAIVQYGQALSINPNYADAHSNLGFALFRQGHVEEAIAQYRDAVRLKPTYAQAWFNLGAALFEQGHTEEAIAAYREAVRLKPAFPEAHSNLGAALFQQGRAEEAIAEYRESLRVSPAIAEVHDNLGLALRQQGRAAEAIAEYGEALRINPAYADAHKNLGYVLFQQGQAGEAVAHLQQALELQPANPAIENSLAWMLATAPEASVRNGARAIELAAQASRSSGGNNPIVIRTLAAAYAEAGQFPSAVQTAQRALQLAEARSMPALTTALAGDIKLYENGQRFGETH